MYSLCNFPYRQHSEKITWGVECSMYLDRFVICLDATTGMIHPNAFFDLIDLQVLQQHPRRLLLRRCNGACSGAGTVCQQHQQVHLGVYDACWLSSVVFYCLSLSFIVFHRLPLSSIVFHCLVWVNGSCCSTSISFARSFVLLVVPHASLTANAHCFLF